MNNTELTPAAKPAPRYSRKQYMEGEVEHDTYYGQFFTPSVEQVIRRCIGIESILCSRDEHFNDIPLKRWDVAGGSLESRVVRAICQANSSTNGGVAAISLSDRVCTLKAGARIMKEYERLNTTQHYMQQVLECTRDLLHELGHAGVYAQIRGDRRTIVLRHPDTTVRARLHVNLMSKGYVWLGHDKDGEPIADEDVEGLYGGVGNLPLHLHRAGQVQDMAGHLVAQAGYQ